jgi:hypothetical protein
MFFHACLPEGHGLLHWNKKDFKNALEHLSQAYKILLNIGRLDGISMVGVYLGQLLYSHDSKQGIEILNRSIEGFQQLGMADWVKQVQNLIDALKKTDEKNES